MASFDPARIAADFEINTPPLEDILSLAQAIDLQDALTATGYGAKEQRDLGNYPMCCCEGPPGMPCRMLWTESMP